MGGEERSNATNAFTSVMKLTQTGVDFLPKSYILPPSQRPAISSHKIKTPTLPIIDLSSLHQPSLRSQMIDEVRLACKNLGCFQIKEYSMFEIGIISDPELYIKFNSKNVINHGIPLSVTNDALAVASEFFDLPNEEKMRFASPNVHTPVRFGTSLNHAIDKVFFWRDFIKHYSHPLSKWIDFWPSNPPHYKKKMGSYAEAVQMLYKQLTELVFESLGIDADYLHGDIEEGSQVMAVNCYPACPEPELSLGLPPHSDYGTLTILLQNHRGLEFLDDFKNWRSVPVIEGALVVQLGDQLEIMSNGKYKSVIHRAVVNSELKRISIASLHSLGLDEKARPAPQLVDDKQSLTYRAASFSEFLNFIAGNDITEKRYIDTLKKSHSV